MSMGSLNFPPVFVGREGEVEAIDESLVKTGLAEIVGVGGSGKTTLATHYAKIRHDRYADRILSYQSYSGTGLGNYVDSITQNLRALNGPALMIIDSAELLDQADTVQAIRRIETGPWLVHFLIVGRISLGLGTTIRIGGLATEPFREALRQMLAGASVSDLDVDRVWHETRGSPFLLRVLLEAWDRDRGRPVGKLGELLSPIELGGLLGLDGRPLRKGSTQERPIIERVQFVTTDLIQRLAVRPDLVFQLSSREFEMLAAELFEREGFEVTLTAATRDGGKDLYLAKSDALGSFRYAVECKRYAPGRPVSVDVVRSLAGVVDTERLTAGIVLTTSRFSRDAINVAAKSQYRMSLHDFTTLKVSVRWSASRRRSSP